MQDPDALSFTDLVGRCLTNDVGRRLGTDMNSTAGNGIVVHSDLARRWSVRNPVAQSVVLRLTRSGDRQTVIESVVRDFSGSVRLAQPQTDLSNLGRIRFVPWLISTLVGILALATLTHALVTLLQRHRGDLAVRAALGMTRRQRRGVGPGAGMVIWNAVAHPNRARPPPPRRVAAHAV